MQRLKNGTFGRNLQCHARTIKEVNTFLEKDHKKEVKDAGLIAEAQRIEHYEISGYGTAARYAKELGLKDIQDKLHKTLEEERKTDEKLNKIAEKRLIREAKKENA